VGARSLDDPVTCHTRDATAAELVVAVGQLDGSCTGNTRDTRAAPAVPLGGTTIDTITVTLVLRCTLVEGAVTLHARALRNRGVVRAAPMMQTRGFSVSEGMVINR
jgi:hypothetical protein